MTKCFFLDETDRAQVSLRRYVSSDKCTCAASGFGYHNAHTVIGTAKLIFNERGYYNGDAGDVPHDDPRWPKTCACGYEFTDTDNWQTNQSRLFKRRDTGEEMTLQHPIPAGAMWYADWMLPYPVGPDGHCLMVKTPGGEWCVDSEASNCTRKGDKSHRCWIRHGEVPEITVDKQGETCAAGAGSIVAGNYHGFLQNGCLT